MPNYIIVIRSRALRALRERAKKLKRNSGIPHHEALDIVARERRFANWPHLIEGAKIIAKSEEAYEHGLILGMDIKDALEHSLSTDGIVNDQIVAVLIEDDFRKSRGELTEEDSYFIDELRDNIMHFRYEGKTPASLDEALEIASRYFYFEPQYLWLKGEWLTPWGKFDYEKEWLENEF